MRSDEYQRERRRHIEPFTVRRDLSVCTFQFIEVVNLLNEPRYIDVQSFFTEVSMGSSSDTSDQLE